MNNLWVLQFNKSDGKRNGAPVYLSGINAIGTQLGAEVGVLAPLTAAASPQVIYVVAGTNDSYAFWGSNTPATEVALNGMMRSVGAEYEPASSTTLMLARIEVPKVDANTTLLTGTLERMFAKVKLNLKNEFPDFTVGYVQMKNVASGMYYRTAQTGSVNFPAVATGSHVDYLVEGCQPTLVYYVPENLRTLGSGKSVNSAGERTLDKTDGKAAYIEIGGYHVTGTTGTQVIYRLPLGDVATNIGDFNVRRNRVYTLDVTLKGANTVDQRITVAQQLEPVTPTAGAVAPANSFMVLPGGTVKFDPTIRGNGSVYDAFTGLERKIAPVSVALVWQDTPGLITNANSTTGVVPLSSGIATVTAKSGTNGNAVVAAYDGANGTGNILWSWHIWVTDYKPVSQASVAANTAYSVTGGQVHTYGPRYLAANPGKVIMDRNLGATQTGTITVGTTSAADAPKAFGMWYQWGRKDPLGRWNGASANTPNFAPWYNAAGATVTSDNVNGRTTVQVAYQNPTTFYYNTYNGPGAGSGTWLSTQNGNLWGDGGAKTIFDPCPAGWKVPTVGTSTNSGTWRDFTSTGGNVSSSSSTEPYTTTIFPYFVNGTQVTASGQYTAQGGANVRNGRLYQQGAVKAWYPAGGERVYGSGSLDNVGSRGYYWTASGSDDQSYCSFFDFEERIWHSYLTYRASGFPVRCIQE